MANTKIQRKDPGAKKDYRKDWSQWLDEGDVIETSTWTVPDELEHVTDSHDDTSATIWLAGGTLGASYTVTNHIVTADGREDDSSFYFTIRDA